MNTNHLSHQLNFIETRVHHLTQFDYTLLLFSVIALFSGCCLSHSTDEKNQTTQFFRADTLQIHQFNWFDDELVTKSKLGVDFGYRFSLIGQFDRDKKLDTLTEHYLSRRDGKETWKFMFGIEMEELYGLIIDRQIESKLISTNTTVPSLVLNEESYGLLFAKVIADVDRDGLDEIALVTDYLDYSNVNSCGIYTLKNQQ